MKQMLLRVSDDLHRRIAARAAREGRSINALAQAILGAAADADVADRAARLRARAADAGSLREPRSSTPIDVAERQRIIATTRGLGPVVDDLLAAERERP